MKIFYTHPDNPQSRHIEEIAVELKNGKIAIIPAHLGYCFAIGLTQKSAFEKLTKAHYDFSVVACQNLSQISQFGNIHNVHFRVLKSLGKTEIIFILSATKDSPKQLQNKKNVAICMATQAISQSLIESLGEPIVLLPLKEPYLAYEIEDALAHLADSFINIGDIEYKNFSIIDLSDTNAVLIKQGDDDTSPFL